MTCTITRPREQRRSCGLHVWTARTVEDRDANSDGSVESPGHEILTVCGERELDERADMAFKVTAKPAIDQSTTE